MTAHAGEPWSTWKPTDAWWVRLAGLGLMAGAFFALFLTSYTADSPLPFVGEVECGNGMAVILNGDELPLGCEEQRSSAFWTVLLLGAGGAGLLHWAEVLKSRGTQQEPQQSFECPCGCGSHLSPVNAVASGGAIGFAEATLIVAALAEEAESRDLTAADEVHYARAVADLMAMRVEFLAHAHRKAVPGVTPDLLTLSRRLDGYKNWTPVSGT